MKNNFVPITQKANETVKIGKTVYTVNHIFTPNQSKQKAWLSIITRAEGIKTART